MAYGILFLGATVMVVAVGAVHGKNGLWAGNGGIEYNLVLWTSAVAVAAMGAGRFSIDRAVGWNDNLSGLWSGVGVLVVSLLGGLLVLATRELVPEPEAADQALEREREQERVSA